MAVLQRSAGLHPFDPSCACVDFKRDFVIDPKDLKALVVGLHGP